MARVLLLSRPGCHLCDDARAVIERVAGELGVGWEERDITTSPQDMAEYWDKIPVTFVDGVQVDFWRISEPRLRGAIHGGLLSRAPFPARAKRDGRTRHAKPTDSRRLRDFALEIEVSAPDLSRYRGVRVHGLERKVARSGSVGSHGAEASGSRGPEASGRTVRRRRGRAVRKRRVASWWRHGGHTGRNGAKGDFVNPCTKAYGGIDVGKQAPGLR